MAELDEGQKELLSYTVSHFKEIARLNRFAENSVFEHEAGRCLVCHPELLPVDPFAVYLEVVTESIKVRRPSLDGPLVHEINGDLALQGTPERVSFEDLISGEEEARRHWRDWLRDALATGLGLLSVHSHTSREFELEEAHEQGLETLIEEKIKELMDFQRGNAGSKIHNPLPR
jgi:hypothetical protein